ncbi:MBL fold metallo-hydrolase [Aquabacterium sp.]|uniref:MBL fold metallo-hydrolase n=1 Tax=Aquabacterium sp. TaxID=1872578 RepID=UPI002C095183|nr:MBL fold metallo-hydrolase [Aquabacterium sp.]HSW07765.1 MBL fold metallo-hydrolase [Aquabacterium sp.]
MSWRFAKRALLFLGVSLLVLALAVAGWLTWQLHSRPSLAPYADRWLPALPAGAQAPVRMTFLGVCTVLLDDGETAILVDGFFTRPPARSVVFGRIAPDREIIARALARAGITRLAAVITVHSHYDHAMDAPEVARQTGALVVGSASTANIARGWGLPEDRIRSVADGDRLRFSRWQIEIIGSRHAPTAVTGGSIDAPLKPPVRATRYAEGGSFSLMLRNGERTMLVQGSAGFVPGKLQGQRADVVLLGIGALGQQDDAYRAAYWHEVVTTTAPRRVIPIHWDDFLLPLDQPLQPAPRLIDDFDRSMRFLIERGRGSQVDVKLAPAWGVVDPFAGLPPPGPVR